MLRKIVYLFTVVWLLNTNAVFADANLDPGESYALAGATVGTVAGLVAILGHGHGQYTKSSVVTVEYKLLNNNEEGNSGTLTIFNNSDRAKRNWQLGFTFPRLISSIHNAKINRQIGDYYLLSGDAGHTVINSHSKLVINFTANFNILHYTDTPSGYFFLADDFKVKAIKSSSVLPKWQPAAGQDEYARNLLKRSTSIEGNPVTDNLAHVSLVPYPAEISLAKPKANFVLRPSSKIFYQAGNVGAKQQADFLVSNGLAKATGWRFKPQPSSSSTAIDNAILLTTKNADSDLGNEGYTLDVTANSIVIRAKTSVGLFYGVESLRQLFPPQIFNSRAQPNVSWRVPALNIKDYPRFKYRGLMLDTARHFFTVSEIERFLDLMALNKLNVLHWHFSDDEGWRPQIEAYPKLTTTGAWRGFGLALNPSLGSGIGPYGGFYSQEDMRRVVGYAALRHVTIIPELDTPGHARALIKSLPAKLVDPSDKSQYTSVQGYHDNVLSPCIESTFTVLKNIVGELVTIFPGHYVHLGSDEVPDGVWNPALAPNCKALMQEKGIVDKTAMQHYFLKRMRNILHMYGKELAGWQEIADDGNDFVDKAAMLAYAWKDASVVKKLVDKGYSVIAIPAPHLYFDLAYSPDPHEPGYYWAGYVDTFAAYNYSPIGKDLTSEEAKHIRGVEAALWSENLISEQRLDYMAFPKVAALAEVAWTPKSKRNWNNFAYRVGHFYLPMLDNYGVKYRVSPPGINYVDSLVNANVEFSDLILHYTLDGSDPTLGSPIYTQPITTDSKLVKMRSAQSLSGRLSRIVTE